MNFDKMIKFIRKKSLLSQNAFAEALGVSFSTINRWENGKSVPQIGMLKCINEFCVENKIPVDISSVICPSTTSANKEKHSKETDNAKENDYRPTCLV